MLPAAWAETAKSDSESKVWAVCRAVSHIFTLTNTADGLCFAQQSLRGFLCPQHRGSPTHTRDGLFLLCTGSVS